MPSTHLGWIAPGIYRYESAGGRFVTELPVNADSFVTVYPGCWQAAE